MSTMVPSAVSRRHRPKQGVGPGKAFVNTSHEYAEAATVHGVSYACSRSLQLVPRILWVIIVLLFLTLAIYWSVIAYYEWVDNPVLTSVKTTGLPITQVQFPAITICAQVRY